MKIVNRFLLAIVSISLIILIYSGIMGRIRG
ncbi:hypothetical protein Q428_05625 [Fervidicella metallireducens AeB]|uniref:Uncharacterized protein n=1 Tax=Fervidicella metallireducens AeB TaxID=1403537 RepID=A0A017RWB0_9CLOT|nr:hypothetical protein Q428_05625 [Fervidicella metallireducens AeB]